MQITTLDKAAAAVQKISENYSDEFVPVKDISFDSIATVRIGNQPHAVKPVAQHLIANRFGIPLNYLEKCPQYLQSQNLNYWVRQERNEKLFFRFDEDKVRAVFTPRYIPADNFQVFDRLNDLGYSPEADVQFSLDDNFMSISILDGNQTFSIHGDKFTPGVTISNSEVGISCLSISAFTLRLVCTNGMISKTEVSESYKHVSIKILNEFPEVLGRVSMELGEQKEKYKISMKTKVDNPISTIESFNRQFQLGKVEKEAVEWAWPLEEGNTMFNIVNTYTKASQRDGLTAHSRFVMQKIGGNVLSMLRA